MSIRCPYHAERTASVFEQFVRQLTSPSTVPLMYIMIRSIDYIPELNGLALTAPAIAHLVLHVYMYIGIQDYNRVDNRIRVLARHIITRVQCIENIYFCFN